MKKFICFLCVVMSMVAFADDTSCRVRDLPGATVRILEENKTSGSNGQVCTTLENTGEQAVNVIVKCYDAYTDQCVRVISVQVNRNQIKTWACFDNVEKNHPYYFRVSDAHCG